MAAARGTHRSARDNRSLVHHQGFSQRIMKQEWPCGHTKIYIYNLNKLSIMNETHHKPGTLFVVSEMTWEKRERERERERRNKVVEAIVTNNGSD
jgi:hypothetical protein